MSQARGGYFAVLSDFPDFRWAFIAYLVNSAGNWINYVAALQVLSNIAPASQGALLTSYFMVARLLPAMILTPITGLIADSIDKRLGLAICNVASAAVVTGFIAIRHTSQIGGFFIVVFLQEALFAQYETIRRAMLPDLVPASDLKVATTLEASVWSLMMAAGAALGGKITSALGTDMNFFLDMLTYVLSACFIMLTSSSGAGFATALTANHGASASKVGKGSKGSGAGDKEGRRSWCICCNAVCTGFSYLCGAPQRRLLGLCLIKASGALTWGLAGQ